VYKVSLSPGKWDIISPPPTSIPVTSCEVQTITIGTRINSTSWHQFDSFQLTIQSTNNSTLIETVTRTTKSPAPVLLVDDDRFFSFAKQYKESLDTNGIAYDYFLVTKSWSGSVPPSPPLETLKLYPMVVWYTAYDWSTPLTTVEEERLAVYLDGGGRLFFSSQDYIYQLPDHRPSSFAKEYLGIQQHTEDFSSTLVIGQPGNPVGDYLGPYKLTFPLGYKNWTDAVSPVSTANIATVGQNNQPNGLTHMGRSSNDEYWHTLFLTFGLELLSKADRARLMQRSVGWLSWLGQSTLTSSATNETEAISGDVIVYTATIKNDGLRDMSAAYFTATFPVALIPTAVSPELKLSNGNLVWHGLLAKDETRQFKYTARVADETPLGVIAQQSSWFGYPEHTLALDRATQVKINFPNLNGSSFEVTPSSGIVIGDVLTYTVVLGNKSMVDVPVVTVSTILTSVFKLISVDTSDKGTVVTDSQSITWSVPVHSHEFVTLTYQTLVTGTTGRVYQAKVYVDDSVHQPIELLAQIAFKQNEIYLPMLRK
jgi:uncharacterized repeat protein (TIGR01451 family)